MRRIIFLSSLLLSACGTGCASKFPIKDLSMPSLTEANSTLTFTCVHEVKAESSSESDKLFNYARWLQKNNQLKEDPKINLEIERLYRIATEHNHYKANINLQNGTMRGHFRLSGEEHLRLSQKLIDAGVATGYYFIGIFLKNGSAGLREDQEMSLRFFRKAADTGNAQAQYLIGEKLRPINIARDTARQMWRCAAEQGHGEAAFTLGVDLRIEKQHQDAVKIFQLGVAAGNSSSASTLNKSFRNQSPTNEPYYLRLQEDQERADRYSRIWRILANYSYANPEVPEINKIVPLPPAPLPEWDGKLQWLEARLANVPPEKPSEGLIHKLAKEKGLDPDTGKPMPGSPAFSQANFPVRVAYSGSVCPQDGYWKVIWSNERTICWREEIKYLKQGEVFPGAMVERFHLRPWPLSNKTTRREEGVEWGLLG